MINIISKFQFQEANFHLEITEYFNWSENKENDLGNHRNTTVKPLI